MAKDTDFLKQAHLGIFNSRSSGSDPLAGATLGIFRPYPALQYLFGGGDHILDKSGAVPSKPADPLRSRAILDFFIENRDSMEIADLARMLFGTCPAPAKDSTQAAVTKHPATASASVTAGTSIEEGVRAVIAATDLGQRKPIMLVFTDDDIGELPATPKAPRLIKPL